VPPPAGTLYPPPSALPPRVAAASHTGPPRPADAGACHRHGPLHRPALRAIASRPHRSAVRAIRSPGPSAWCTAGVPSQSPSQRSSFPPCRVLCLCAHDSSTDPLTRSAQPRIPNDDARMKVQIHFLVYTISFAVCFHFSSKHTTICPFDIYMLLRYYLFTDLLTDSGDVARSYSPRCS